MSVERDLSVAFLGLGLMGAPMAARIAEAGFPVSLWNRSAKEIYIKRRARMTTSIREAVSAADIIIIMVSDGDAVDDVLFAQGGVANAAMPGACVAVMSSIPPDLARSQAARLVARDIAYVDAPVSGGEQGAKAGALAIMAGGAAQDLEKLEGVFQFLGRLTHIGPVGAGQLAKLANQLIVGVTIGAVAEALRLLEAGGAEASCFAKAVAGGFAESAVLKIHGAQMLRGDFEPGAHASTQFKDLRTAQMLAESFTLDLPMLNCAADLYGSLCETELARCDHSILYEWLCDERRQKSR